jgi:hypothetical protein
MFLEGSWETASENDTENLHNCDSESSNTQQEWFCVQYIQQLVHASRLRSARRNAIFLMQWESRTTRAGQRTIWENLVPIGVTFDAAAFQFWLDQRPRVLRFNVIREIVKSFVELLLQYPLQFWVFQVASNSNGDFGQENYDQKDWKLKKYSINLIKIFSGFEPKSLVKLTVRVIHELSLTAPQHPKNEIKKIMLPTTIKIMGADQKFSPRMR